MTDLKEPGRCDGCGDIRFMHHSSYELASKVADVESSPDAVDIRQSGDLCDACAYEVAKTIKQLGDGE